MLDATQHCLAMSRASGIATGEPRAGRHCPPHAASAGTPALLLRIGMGAPGPMR